MTTSRPTVRWQPGEVVALRYITRQGTPGMSWPCRVVEDTDGLLALFIARGSTYRQWGVAEDGSRALVEGSWRRDVLRLMYPGASYSIWLFWEHDPDRRFSAYYVNMEEPFRRTAIGVDTNDHMLDIVVAPDLAWRWKDDEVLDERIAQGVYSVEFVSELRREARAVVDRIERREPPFDGAWESWSPEPAWQAPVLPGGWDTLEPVLWERRHWAYLDATR